MARLWGGGQWGKELPRPQWTVALLWVLGVLLWVVSAASVVVSALLVPQDAAPQFWINHAAALFTALVTGAMAIGLALVVKYTFSAAVSAKLMERLLRDAIHKRAEGEPSASTLGAASHEEVVSLLSEIMENTLLDDSEKATKRELAKKHRQQAMRREVEAFIKAGKYRDARERLEEFRLRYPESAAAAQMEAQLSEALRQHEHSEIANVTEQVQRYMGLGLWERAMELAKGLAEQFPENPDAAHLPETVQIEQAASRRQEQQRLFREVEHLVARKHWRQALRDAETLLENHPDSPEAQSLRGQIEDLRRNAAIEERKEWEARIAEHVQTGRHREAYALAMDLVEKYPDSPQADDIRRNLEQLKARAGIAR
ncbi:MAG: tetratricopeptide repeat protein [Planctomycetes bacterium]|nr:tetratricopeptide repeat protein [Planctomycetota bacterium]